MQLIYCALLLHGAGKPITEENVKKIVTSIGSDVNDVQIKALVAALDGVNIQEAIEKAAMPVVAAPVSGGAAAPAEKKEEKKEEDLEKKTEEAAAGLSALFG